MLAAAEGNIELVKLFLCHGVSVVLKDKVSAFLITATCTGKMCKFCFQNDMTALDIAQLNQHVDVYEELKQCFKVKPKREHALSKVR